MINFEHYENAVAEHHKSIRIKTTPVSSWDFHCVMINDMKNSFIDFNMLEQIASMYKWNNPYWDIKNKLSEEEVIIVTDAQLSIVFASQNITKMNGYTPDEVIGKSPSMFQGKKTSAFVSKQIRKAIQLKQPFEKKILNYKKNGDIYTCLINGYPIYNVSGEFSHFIAFEKAA
ncbi:PAS domain-containing protein [Flavobacterium sp. WC2421]|jgi:PAS domain S-box-containing protein|uniref:PAS domain-containing protein n=3 Tax=unclassified Flavobacterium TaxID=196869 RepID=A0AB39WC16_9FLAO